MGQITLNGVTKRFGDVEVIPPLDLRVEDGEFVVFVGPSGCGKSTLLRLIAGLEDTSDGRIVIDGKDATALSPAQRGLAMVFQSYALYPHMSVYNNIAFPLKAQKIDKAAQRQKVEWAASILGIDQLLKRKPRQLSGGQRQRVALARALVRDPNVFLLDEPLSNLDAQRRASARDELQQFQRRVGTTTIYVTHDQVEAMGMGDRIAVIDQGRVRQLGSPREIYDEPADTFVATFLGSPPMNLVPRDGALLGFRPEHFGPVEPGPSTDGRVTFSFHVHREEYLGVERLLYGEIGDAKAVARFPAQAPVEAPPGGTYQFAVQTRDLKVFDRESGLRRQGEAPRP